MSQGSVAIAKDIVGEQFHRELSEGTIEVPLLPSVAAEVLSSTLGEEASATRLADLIQQDQGLASHLLRVVNTPAFRGSAEIVALQQAIARLGMDRIREIALTVSIKSTLFDAGPFEHLLERAWQHGLRTGLWAKEVARSARKNVEIAYLCGLLHNVGEPLVINRVSQLDASLSDEDVCTLASAFGQDAGNLLVTEWNLPAWVGLSIRFKNDFSQAGSDADTVAVVAAGSLIARHQASGELDPESVLQDPAVQHLNFYPDDLEKLLEHAETVQLTVQEMA